MSVRTGLVAAGRGAGLALLALGCSLVLFCLSVASIALVPVWIGAVTTPWLVRATRAHADSRRRMAREGSGVEIDVPYRRTPRLGGGPPEMMRRCRWLLTDRVTWRELLWLIVDPTAGFLLGMLCAVLVVYGAWGFVLAAGVWRPLRDIGYWYAFVPVDSQLTALAAAALGVGFIAVGLRAAPAVLRVHALLTKAFLAPDPERALELRLAHATESRTDPVDVSVAELRRIERDLHDGAQAQLVAMGMSLDTVKHLMRTDPAKAAQLLAETRRSSAEVLDELRRLVRGVHPPVLVERGLCDAVRALALRIPLTVEVAVEPMGRMSAPVEAAAYFAVTELLTNVAKHAEAQRVRVDMRHEDGTLRITVTDDGKGGADFARGTGLTGIQRRLGAFDGVLALDSPPGGPTSAAIELPCALLAAEPHG